MLVLVTMETPGAEVRTPRVEEAIEAAGAGGPEAVDKEVAREEEVPATGTLTCASSAENLTGIHGV